MRFTSADMTAGRRRGEAAKPPAPAVKSKRIAIPKGGSADVRAADNGVIVTVQDANYNRVSQTVSLDPAAVSFEKK